MSCEHHKTCIECPSPAWANQARRLEDEQRERAEKAEARVAELETGFATINDLLRECHWPNTGALQFVVDTRFGRRAKAKVELDPTDGATLKAKVTLQPQGYVVGSDPAVDGTDESVESVLVQSSGTGGYIRSVGPRSSGEAKVSCARPSCPHPNGGRAPLERLGGREGLLRDPYCCGECLRRHLDEQRGTVAGDVVTLQARVEEIYAEGKALRVRVEGFGSITVPASAVQR